MPRIEGVDATKASMLTRLVYKITKRKIGKLTGTPEVVEPVRIMAHHPKILMAFGMMDSGLENSTCVPIRYKYLAFTRTARMIGCPF